jgi:hypothetical protein
MAFAFIENRKAPAPSVRGAAEPGADGTRPTQSFVWSMIVPTDGTNAARVANENFGTFSFYGSDRGELQQSRINSFVVLKPKAQWQVAIFGKLMSRGDMKNETCKKETCKNETRKNETCARCVRGCDRYSQTCASSLARARIWFLAACSLS